MNNLLKITKINLLTFFDIYKIKNAKNKEERNIEIRRFGFLIFVLLLLSFSVYIYADKAMEGFMQIKLPYLLIIQFMAIASTMILITNIFRINSVLFEFSDRELLFSLPIKKSHVITSKLIHLYITNLIYELILLIPTYILYIINVKVNLTFHIFYFITLFVIPLVPIIIATIIGSLLTSFSSLFKYKKIMNYLITFGFVGGMCYLSTSLENMDTIDIANIGKSMVEIYNKIYPLTGLYLEIIRDYNLLSLITFILIPIILFTIYIIIITKFYNKIISNLKKEVVKANYKIKKMKTSSPIIALYKKELKRYFSSVNYVMNTSVGALLLTISVIAYIILGNEKLDAFLVMPGFSNLFALYGPILLGSFCLLSSTTHPSISLEGKSFWILKTLPVSIMTIFMSKILVNLTILIPVILINGIILSIYLKSSIITTFFMVFLPTLYALFTSMLGIIINTYFVDLNYTHEIKVIKQSPAAFISLSVGGIIAMLPFIMNINLNIYVVTIIAIIINIITYLFMKKVSVKVFKCLTS